MKRILNILIAIIPFAVIAQKQGNIWYFGIQSGLDFSNGAPVVLANGQTGTDLILGGNQEGSSNISDSSGNLLFYTGGKTIWNRNHIPMPNGTGIMGGTSSTQSSIIVPLPGSDSIFYVFTSDEFQSYTSPPEKGYRYTIVNMCLDGGNGDVISGQKNILLCDSSTEKLSACKDAGGAGYWIMGHKMFSDEFLAWHLTSTGITSTVISKIGSVHGRYNSSWLNGAAQGEMKFNVASTKLALAIGNFNPAILDLFDFDSSTGLLSNPCHIVIDSALQKNIYGIEFSPDASKLYAGVMGGSGGKRLYQFDLMVNGGNCDSIKVSRKKLFQSSTNSFMFGMQLAPDNKIYLVCNTQYNLGCINLPNLAGIAADFDSSAIAISGEVQFSLPNFIAGYKYHNGIPCSVGSGIEEKNKNSGILVYPNPFSTSVSFTFNLPQQNTELKIFDLLGKKVKELTIPSGTKEFILKRENLESGVYFYQVISEDKRIFSGKLLVQ